MDSSATETARQRSWVIPTVMICSYGFLKEVRPSEAFLTPFLKEDKNLTEEQVDNQIYPVWTYSYMAALIFVFLLTDLLRYKPVLIFEGLAYIATWCLLLWAYGVTAMKMMQFAYGLATSTETAYYSYIFASVSADHYQQVSSYTRSALLAGRFISSALAQLLISLDITTYMGLNYISLTFVSLAFVLSLFLPSVRKSVYFHRHDDQDSLGSGGASNDAEMSVTRQFAKNLWTDFRSCFSNRSLLLWSLWWAFATCGNFQVGNYIQNLWDVIIKSGTGNDSHNIYYGAVIALATLHGAISSFLIMFLPVNWDNYGEILLGLVSLADAVLLVFMGLTHNIWVSYAFYIIFSASYQLVITIATFQIAKHLTLDRYALVFGWNTFVALVLETILTVIVVDSRTLNLPPDTQFVVYGGYFGALGIAFCTKAVYNICRRCYGSNYMGATHEMSATSSEERIEDERRGEVVEEEESLGREIDEVLGGDTQGLVN